MTEDSKPLTLSDLAQFTGTGHWYRHSLVRAVTYTDGVKYLADRASAYWLLDIIATTGTMTPPLRDQPFQVWKLVVDQEKHTAVLTVSDGNGNDLYTHKIDFTDFPMPEVTVWFVNKVILLPSEY